MNQANSNKTFLLNAIIFVRYTLYAALRAPIQTIYETKQRKTKNRASVWRVLCALIKILIGSKYGLR